MVRHRQRWAWETAETVSILLLNGKHDLLWFNFARRARKDVFNVIYCLAFFVDQLNTNCAFSPRCASHNALKLISGMRLLLNIKAKYTQGTQPSPLGIQGRLCFNFRLVCLCTSFEWAIALNFLSRQNKFIYIYIYIKKVEIRQEMLLCCSVSC